MGAAPRIRHDKAERDRGLLDLIAGRLASPRGDWFTTESIAHWVWGQTGIGKERVRRALHALADAGLIERRGGVRAGWQWRSAP